MIAGYCIFPSNSCKEVLQVNPGLEGLCGFVKVLASGSFRDEENTFIIN